MEGKEDEIEKNIKWNKKEEEGEEMGYKSKGVTVLISLD